MSRHPCMSALMDTEAAIDHAIPTDGLPWGRSGVGAPAETIQPAQLDGPPSLAHLEAGHLVGEARDTTLPERETSQPEPIVVPLQPLALLAVGALCGGLSAAVLIALGVLALKALS